MSERVNESQRLAPKFYELFNMTIGPAQPEMWNRMDKAGWLEYFEAELFCENFDPLRHDLETIKQIADEEGVREHSRLADECLAELDDYQNRFGHDFSHISKEEEKSTGTSGKWKRWRFPWKRS